VDGRLVDKVFAIRHHDAVEFALPGRRHQELISIYLEAVKRSHSDGSLPEWASLAVAEE